MVETVCVMDIQREKILRKTDGQDSVELSQVWKRTRIEWPWFYLAGDEKGTKLIFCEYSGWSGRGGWRGAIASQLSSFQENTLRSLISLLRAVLCHQWGLFYIDALRPVCETRLYDRWTHLCD